jgi:lipid II:glycine glycyltransferase (peptidoglycan interpeptide bridge formation enzyme)
LDLRTARWTPRFEKEDWDAFIEGNGGTPYQSWAWRSVLEDCGNDPEYLAYRNPGGAIIAACPLFRARVGMYRQRLMGPVSSGRVYGTGESREPRTFQGILPIPTLFGPGADVTVAARALQRYLEGLRFPPVSSLDLMTSQTRVVESLAGLGFRNWKAHGDFLTDLAKTPPDRIWSDVFGKHDRQAVKYFDGLGASFSLSSGEDEFKEFLKLHESTMLREGYHPITPGFLALMRRHLGERLQLALSVISDDVIAGQLLILDRANKTVYIDKVGYSRLRNIHSSVVALWFKVCRWAEDNGFRYVNFGGARSDEALRLKRKFGGEYIEYHVFVVPTASKLYPAAAGLLKGARRLGKVVSRGT